MLAFVKKKKSGQKGKGTKNGCGSNAWNWVENGQKDVVKFLGKLHF